MSSRIYFDIISICYNTSNISTKKGYTHINFRIEMTEEILEMEKRAAKWLMNIGVVENEPDWNNFIDWEILKSVAPDRVKMKDK